MSNEKTNETTPLILQRATRLQSPSVTSREEELSSSPRRLRFAKFFAFFAVLWLGYTFHAHYRVGRVYDSLTITPKLPIPIPPDVTIKYCADWAEDVLSPADALPRYSSSAAFKLPVSSDTLFLMSRGAVAGSVNVIQSHEIGDVATVQMVAKYEHQGDTDRVRVCSISRGDNDDGVGFFGPKSRPDSYYVQFEVTFHLPRSPENSPLHINNLATDMPLFSHTVGDTATTTTFNTVSLKTVLMPINIQSLYATKIKLETSTGAIRGSLNTSSLLEVSTARAPIDVNVGLFNGKDSEATELTMHSNYSPINAIISLASSSNTGGKFAVTSTASMSPLNIAFLTAPNGSTLLLDARTSNSPASVQLHGTYEGAFNLVSTNRQPVVLLNENAEDPTGKSRERKLELDYMNSTHAIGSIRWSDQEASGSVRIEALTSSAFLEL